MRSWTTTPRRSRSCRRFRRSSSTCRRPTKSGPCAKQGERLLAEAESDARWLADREADLAANACTITRAELAAEYEAFVERQYRDAEDYCRGVLLSRKAAAAGIHPRTLFSGPSHVAYARASEELRRYWADVEPRMTKVEFAAHISGHWTDAAETARYAAYDAWRAA